GRDPRGAVAGRAAWRTTTMTPTRHGMLTSGLGRLALSMGLGLAVSLPVAAAPPVPPTGQLWQDASPSPVDPELARLNGALTELAERLKPALVQIRVRRTGPDATSEDAARRALGSGFLVHPDGYLVTNAHVVEGATTVQVRLASGRRLVGTVIGRDN